MPGLFGPSFVAVENAMRFRLTRQGALAANVANADTPHYRRKDVRFDAALERAGLVLATPRPGHLGTSGARGVAARFRLETDPTPSRLDGNNVNLDRELVRLSRNAGAFTEQATVMSRLFELRRTALGEGR